MEAVEGTTVKDLDQLALARTLARTRQGSSSLRDIDDLLALRRLKIITDSNTNSPVTIAGLLTFGVFPQEFFPQLMFSVVVHPPEGDPSVRFLDNVTVRGNIPDAISEALAVIRRNLAARAIISDTGRTDHLDYPMPAIREALVNAALHRDYSPVTRGAQVQVDLFPDRLVVRSPGGLYGNIAVDDLGVEGTTSSRNSVLASLLSDAYLPRSEELVAENRASGVPSMIALARRNGLPRPIFRSTITSFVVTMSRSELLGPEVRAWIHQLNVPLPTSFHEIALAMMRTAPVTNAMLREWGADRITAGQVLRDLTDQKIAVKEGGRRFARYELDPALRAPRTVQGNSSPRMKSELLDALRVRRTASTSELQEETGLSRSTIQTQLNQLISQGLVRAEGETRSPKRRYSWIGGGAVADRAKLTEVAEINERIEDTR